MTLLDRIDDTLSAHDATHAEATGHPWPGRVPSLDEMLEVLFGSEDGAPVPMVPIDMGPHPREWFGDAEPRVAPTWCPRLSDTDLSFIAIGREQLRHCPEPWLEREAEWLTDRAEREGDTPGPLAPAAAPAPMLFADAGGYFIPGSLVFEWSQPQIDEMTANAAALLGTLPTVEFTISGFFVPQQVSVWLDEWVHARYRPPGWTAQDSRMRSAYRRRSLARRRRGRR